MSKLDIVCFGHAIVDVFITTDTSENNGFLCYNVGDKVSIKDLRFDFGGGGLNTSVGFSRLGLKTGYIGKLGEDDNSRRILEKFKKEKVEFLGKVHKDVFSGYSVILRTKQGNRVILTYNGDNIHISLNEIKKFNTKWVYFSSLLGKNFTHQKDLAKKLKNNGVMIAFNPSAYMIKAENVLPMIHLTDVLILNKEEAELLVKKGTKKELLDRLNKLGPKIIAITDGENVVSCFANGEYYFAQPKKIKGIEKTGAGDAFSSGFITGLIKNKPIEEAINLGLKESLSVIKQLGATNGLLKIKIK